MKHALRAVASAFMLMLMVAVLGALAAATLLTVATALVIAVKAGGAWAVGAGIVVLGVLATAGVGLLAARRRRRQAFVGVPVSAYGQPLLWVAVSCVAEDLGTRPPDELSLTPDANIAASEHRTLLGLRPGARRLDLGLPLLAGLTERQLRVVITRELCRRWGPWSTGRVIHRGGEIIGLVVDTLGEESKIGRIFSRYGRAYFAVSGPVSRRHALEMDRLSAELVGNGATSAALRELAILRVGWDAFVNGFIEPAVAAGRRPHDVLAGFAEFLKEPDRWAQLQEEVDGAAPRPTAYGSQLSLKDRETALASLPEDETLDRSGPAMDLLRDSNCVIGQVEESIFRESGLVHATWKDIVPESGCAVACEDALQLARLGHEGGLGPALSVATLMELISLGLADEMVRPMLAEGAPQEAERQMAVRLVTGFLATAAIESGTASYRFSWAVPCPLVDDQGVVDNLPRLVDTALADQSEVRALEQWLEFHRVDRDLELGTDLGQAVPEGPAGDPAESPNTDAGDDPEPLPVPVHVTASI